MTVALPQYAKIKDRYCIAYLGCSDEYLIQLLSLRPNMEKRHGVPIYLSCRDQVFHLLEQSDRTLLYTTLKDNERYFPYIFNMTCNLVEHPVEAMLLESDVPIKVVRPDAPDGNGKCVIFPDGTIPTHPMTKAQVERCVALAHRRGLTPHIGGSYEGASLVIGVENWQLFSAAAKGIPVALVPSGLGTNLYRRMFGGEILE